MSIPAGYVYKDGFFWRLSDGSGPYVFDGSSMSLVGTGTGGGGSVSGGGGSDRTAVTYEVDPVNGGYRVATETVDGIPWTQSYDVLGRLITREWVAGGLEAVIYYDAEGFGYGDDTTNIFVKGGAIQVFSAQMAALKTALAALGTDISAQFYVADFDSNRGLLLEWNHVNQCFRGVGGAPICFWSAVSLPPLVAPGTVDSNLFTPVTFPGWLRGPQGRWECEVWFNAPGDVGNKTARWLANSNIVLTLITGTVTVNAICLRASLQAISTSLFQPFAGSASAANGFGVTNVSEIPATFSITADTDFTIVATNDYSDSGDGGNTVTIPCARIDYYHP